MGNTKTCIGGTLCVSVVLIIVIVCTPGIKRLEKEDAALKYHTLFRHLSSDAVGEGVQWAPIGTRWFIFKKTRITLDMTGAEAIRALTSDGIIVRIQATIEYELDVTKLREIVLEWDESGVHTFVMRLAQDAMRNAASEYTAEMFYTDKRVLTERIRQMLQLDFSEYNSYCKLGPVQIIEIDYPDQLEDALRAKQDAKIQIEAVEGAERERHIIDAKRLLDVSREERLNTEVIERGKAIATVTQATQQSQGVEDELFEKALSWKSMMDINSLNSEQMLDGYLLSIAIGKSHRGLHSLYNSSAMLL